MIQQMTAQQLKVYLKTNAPLLLDVRQPHEHSAYAIPGAILIPLDQLAHRVNEISAHKHSEIVVYCKAGVRSASACDFLAAEGFERLINLSDGILGYLA